MIRNAFKICSLFLVLILCFSACSEARQSNESSGVWEGQASIEAFETEIAQPDTNVTATSGGNVDSAVTSNGSNKGEMGGHHGGMGRPGGLRW